MAVDSGDSAIPRLRREREARDAEISAMLAEFDDKASDVVNLDSCEEASETSDEELATPDCEGCDLEVPENLDGSVYDGSSDEGAALRVLAAIPAQDRGQATLPQP